MADGNPSAAPVWRQDAPGASNPPRFSATLTPHRSLGPRGFIVVIALVGLTSFIAGILFLRLGAWPVVGFFGLDFLLVWAAFHLNFRSARAFEEIDVRAGELTIRKIAANGRMRAVSFNPAWVRLDIARDDDNLVTAIHVWFRDRAIPVGSFLNPADRTAFAGAFVQAVASAGGRRG